MKTKTLVKKIETVTALQYLGEKNKYEVCEFFKGIKFTINFEQLPLLVITTDDGYYKINPKDWLIKKSDGDIYYLEDNKMSEYFEESDIANTIANLNEEIAHLNKLLNESKKETRIEGKAKSEAHALIEWHQSNYTKLKKEYDELKFRMDGLEK
jgi:hypothetical protein